ncbi:MAG: exosortase system-associated protein, TIGR04073 family [bacterium]|nr:exosortase system-associated protein, TIGR04073 family [bacterium]
MKTIWMITVSVVLLTASIYAAVDPNTLEDEANVMRQARSADLWFEKWGFKMTRGIVNAATCWVELPRCVHVETMDNPVVGPMKGLFKGLGLTVVRAVAGTMDLATFGTVDDTYTIYDRYAFPYFVWQNWNRSER